MIKLKLTLQDYQDNYSINKQDNKNLQIVKTQTNEQHTNITKKMETSLLLVKQCLEAQKETTLTNLLSFDNEKVFANNVNSLKSSLFSSTWNTTPLVKSTPLQDNDGKKIGTQYLLTDYGTQVINDMTQARENEQ